MNGYNGNHFQNEQQGLHHNGPQFQGPLSHQHHQRNFSQLEIQISNQMCMMIISVIKDLCLLTTSALMLSVPNLCIQGSLLRIQMANQISLMGLNHLDLTVITFKEIITKVFKMIMILGFLIMTVLLIKTSLLIRL
jgi:hypothetical protein